MVLLRKTYRPGLNMEELYRRFPMLLAGFEGEGEGGAETPPPGGNEPGATTTDPPAPPGQEDPKQQTFDREYVETLRSENASRRQREKDLEAELEKHREAEKEREKAEMSEADRAKTEAAEEKAKREAAEAQLIVERKRNAIIAEASKLKFLDPEDALVHIDLEEIRMTDDGKPHKTSVESAVKKIADDKKYLVAGPGSADGGTRGNHPDPKEVEKKYQEDIANRGGVPVG